MVTYLWKSIELIDIQIRWVERQLLSEQTEQYPEKLEWTGTQMEFVELLYALHEAECFGKISLKKLFVIISKVFSCKIANYYRLFWDIKNRTAEERTFFLNKLKKMLSDKLVRMDSGGRN